MRKITKIIVHCTATPEGRDVKTETIRKWHINDNKWKDIGYHYIIELDGNKGKGRDESIAGAHIKGYNSDSIGISYVGGCDSKMKPKDTRTDAQKATLETLLRELKDKYPQAVIYGHNDFDKGKACPSFNTKKEYEHIK